jgi:hypothetical protein
MNVSLSKGDLMKTTTTNPSRLTRHPRVAMMLMTTVLAVACGGGGGNSDDGNATPPSTLASDCSSPVLTSVGTTFRFDYARFGASTGSSSTVGSVKRLTTFEGQADVTEVEVDNTDESQPAGQPAVRQSTNLLSYLRRAANADTLYGSVLTVVAGADQGTVVRTVFSPPFVDERFTLAAGQRLTFTIAATVTTTLPSGREQVNTTSGHGTGRYLSFLPLRSWSWQRGAADHHLVSRRHGRHPEAQQSGRNQRHLDVRAAVHEPPERQSALAPSAV